MRRSVTIAIALACIVAPAPAVAAGSSHRDCALGTSNAAALRSARAIVDAARARFERSLSGVSAARRREASTTFSRAVDAYLYGFPQVMMQRTIASFPRNQMLSIAKLADADTTTVVAPNHDTLYSVAQLDLSDGPLVVHAPPTGGRYSVIQLLDAFTDVAAYVGDGARATAGETALVVPPGWRGRAPRGMRVVRPASESLWLLGRTFVAGAADTGAAVRLLRRYSVTPLAAYETGGRTGPVVLADFPTGRKPVAAPRGTAFFDELGRDLVADPAPRRDTCALRAFAAAGIGPHRTPSTATGLRARALRAAASAGPRALAAFSAARRHARAQTADGWTVTPHDTGRYGTDYLTRALIAQIGLGANTVERALYPTADRDSRGRRLTGVHDYVLHFPRGRLPPVRAFWSVTLYDRRRLFYANRLQRFSLGSRTRGLLADGHGGLTIYVSHRDPGRARRANWLPAPRGPFSLYLRLYEPRAAAGRGHWHPPSIMRIR